MNITPLNPNIIFYKGYSNFRNKLKEETNKSGDPYLWLEPYDPRRKMTDQHVMKSTIALNWSGVSKEEQEEVYNL